ncbi:MAG: phytanoyl-CoA dioxygenase family protein [Candidatus Puniceispirillaceae bacterium]
MDKARLKQDYDINGYVVIDALLSQDEIATLLAETVAIARGKRGDVRGITPASDDQDDDAVLAQYLTVQFPHKASPLIRDDFIAHPKIAEILSVLIGPDVKAMQSMLFIKKSGKPGQAWHQDEYFIPTRDRSLTGVWIALDDAVIENGCLWVRPGSHRDGIIYDTAPHHSAEFDEGSQLVGTRDDTDDGIAVEVKAGDAVIFNGYLHHRSLANRAPAGTFRRALVNHYMSAQSLLPWDWDGRIPATRDMRDIMMVCGNDPYAYKGIEDITFAFLRAESADDPNADPDKKVF